MNLLSSRAALAGLACVSLLAISTVGLAMAGPDPVSISTVSAGHGKVRLTVTAGPSGTPYGFEVRWMTSSQFAGFGGSWPAPRLPGLGWADYTGIGTLNTWGGAQVDFKLAPNQSLDVEVGDDFDESGVAGTLAGELSDDVDFVFGAFALGADGSSASLPSITLSKATSPQGQNCTYTQGYWKNHSSAWPVSSLTLGTVTYTKAQLLQILGQPVVGNGLISLAHQLIATKLNIAGGASPSTVASTVAAADALIGARVVPSVGSGSLAPSLTDGLTQVLDDYNNGITGPGHCGATSVKASNWGQLKVLYR